MKKFLSLIVIVFSILIVSNVCYANEYLGDAVALDIVTYINHVPIQSYNFNGRTLVVAEDLVDFGFVVRWNEYKETLTIYRNIYDNTIDIPWVTCPTGDDVGRKEFDVTTTNIGVYIGNSKVPSFGGIDGYTLIDVESLSRLENINIVWHPEVKALKVWVEDGLEMYNYMVRPLPEFEYYDLYDATDYEYYWDWYDSEDYFNLSFYLQTDDGYCVYNDYGRITITDVIDADGNSILKRPVSTSTGTSIWPYRFDYTDAVLSMNVYLDKDDIYPQAAFEEGGLIKFTYAEYGYGTTFSETVRVERLPYGKFNNPKEWMYI